MAVTVTLVRRSATMAVHTVIATADADVAAVIPHGLGVVPERFVLTPRLPQAYVSAWSVGVVDAVNVNLVAAATVGSGVAGVQLQVATFLRDDIER